jgi:hypothetical protein
MRSYMPYIHVCTVLLSSISNIVLAILHMYNIKDFDLQFPPMYSFKKYDVIEILYF